MYSPSTRVQNASFKRDIVWENHLDFMACILYRWLTVIYFQFLRLTAKSLAVFAVNELPHKDPHVT